MTNRKGIRIGYAVAAFAILIAEVLIALYVRDAFVRPYGGDILVTLLICCILRVVWPQRYRLPIAGGVLAFAVLVEVGQYFGLVYLLGLGHIEFFRILIGTEFRGGICCAMPQGVGYSPLLTAELPPDEDRDLSCNTKFRKQTASFGLAVCFCAKLIPIRKTKAGYNDCVKNKFPISENNIEKPLDKIPRMVYNDANERNKRRPAAYGGIQIWQRNPRNPSLPL